mmetsp:Transcript_103/g.219  ORF Transcript_103/g.219 Transcript_103/m.219 type:complete len:127 (-) Transcript_103:833-1213(-)
MESQIGGGRFWRGQSGLDSRCMAGQTSAPSGRSRPDGPVRFQLHQVRVEGAAAALLGSGAIGCGVEAAAACPRNIAVSSGSDEPCAAPQNSRTDLDEARLRLEKAPPGDDVGADVLEASAPAAWPA